MNQGPVSSFLKRHYRHFNAATLVEAAEAYSKHLAHGGKMFLTLGWRNEYCGIGDFAGGNDSPG